MTRDRVELFVASFLMLFVELVLIRWAGAQVVHLSYFANFILLGSFLGIGVGFLRAHRGPDLFRWAPAALALLAGFVAAFPASIDRTGGDLVYFGVEQRGLPAWVLLPIIFIAVAATLTTIAHGVAMRFQRFPALEAYRLDILGSIAGVLAFSVASLLDFGPISWAIVILAAFVVLLRRPTLLQWTSLAVLAVLFVLGATRSDSIWSPYYWITFSHRGPITAVEANGVPHQAAQPTEGTDYELPYERVARPPERVLVIGAGNGNDVAVALRSGATSVDAVEIDPELQAVGVRFHPERPYQDPRVHAIVADGREFLERTDRTYDLIIFALPDSLTLLSGQSSVRLESFLFTEEAIEIAASRLSEDGAFAMYNYYRERWLADRLAGTLTQVFGNPPCFDIGNDQGGDVGRLAMMVASSDPAVLRCEVVWTPQGEVAPPVDDDRPFLYLREPSIPGRYLVALGFMLVGSALFVRAAGGRFRPMVRYLDLFLMGAAFLLLETKSVVQYALLFGTTWFVNALVFGGILVSVLLAIEVERRVRIGRPRLLLGLLLAGLLLAGLVPSSFLLGLPFAPRLLLASLLAFFPIFVANLIFAERFRDTDDPTSAFGANLLGAMVGGAIEYLSLLTGYRALLVIAGVLYVAAYVATSRVAPRRAVQPAAVRASVPVGDRA